VPITLNIDLGEKDGEPEELYALADVVNIACGGHAGDEASMEIAVRSAFLRARELAAHPSYVDRAGFGRTPQDVAPGVLRDQIAQQCVALRTVAARMDLSVTRVKPHGALYHDANARPEIALALLDGAMGGLALGPSELVMSGPPEGALSEVAKSKGIRFLREGFADRGYGPDGQILPRSAPGALIEDPVKAAEHTEQLVRSKRFDTLCVHSDTPNAVAIARAVRAVLQAFRAR
jgi:5-oxoprolinase (ATP-hydrolysing) subunit A